MSIQNLLCIYETRINTLFPGAVAARQSSHTVPLWATMEHLLWMIESSHTHIASGRTSKAFRWLGYLEGTLVSLGVMTVAEIQFLDIRSAIDTGKDEALGPWAALD